MQKTGSRGGYSKNAALESEFLTRQLSNADLIKRLKVRPCLPCAFPLRSPLLTCCRLLPPACRS